MDTVLETESDGVKLVDFSGNHAVNSSNPEYVPVVCNRNIEDDYHPPLPPPQSRLRPPRLGSEETQNPYEGMESKEFIHVEFVQHLLKIFTGQKQLDLLNGGLCLVEDEHFGIVPLEAMAACKPVIACNSGGPVETIRNGETGFLCDPTPQDFALAMAKYIKQPQMAEKMGREARHHVSESFSRKTFGKRLNQFLFDVARSKKE
ncbi:Glycosyl transferase, family 1 [Dillenia turbinata]|uniref:Glycosyl transferase, family 1 n=1 Tax=Dillenia turbinata TaxID=194707 RepID=A0AAN8U962_9MAGN